MVAIMRITFRCDPALIDRLERPVPARTRLPMWLKDMPAAAFSELHGQEVRTVKQCPPFIDAMSHGFVMPLPCDILVRDGRLSWDWDLPPLSVTAHPRSPLSFHAPAQVSGTPFHREDRAIVKFNSFWTIELEQGHSLFATHPANRDDLPFRLLSGMVDADRFSQVGILFPAQWVDPDFEGVLPRGTPIAQCFPVAREPLDLDCLVFEEAQKKAYDEMAARLLAAPGVYRKSFRVKRTKSEGETASESIEIEP
jgi:hypothetical protein